MKHIQKFVAVGVIAALAGAGLPAMAAEHSYQDRGRIQYQSAGHRNDRDGSRDRNHYFGNDDRWDRGRIDTRHGQSPAYVYAPAPVYRGPVYDYGYSGYRSHNGRTAAIIGGSAAAGAVIGAAVGHGQGAVIGAVIGGLAGTVAGAAADQHDRY